MFWDPSLHFSFWNCPNFITKFCGVFKWKDFFFSYPPPFAIRNSLTNQIYQKKLWFLKIFKKIVTSLNRDIHPEFLKAATVRPCCRAKMFRNCAKLGFLNPKMHNLPHFHLFGVISLIFKSFFMPFYLRKISQQKSRHAKLFAFRKSVSSLVIPDHMLKSPS